MATGSLIVTGVSVEYKISKNGYIQSNSNKAYMQAAIRARDVHIIHIDASWPRDFHSSIVSTSA